MSTAGWIFLVGMRVIDIGALIVWLVWFMRQHDEPEEGGWDDGGGPPPPARPRPNGPRGPGFRLLPDARPWPGRRRDHTAPGPARIERRGAPLRREPAAPSKG